MLAQTPLDYAYLYPATFAIRAATAGFGVVSTGGLLANRSARRLHPRMLIETMLRRVLTVWITQDSQTRLGESVALYASSYRMRYTKNDGPKGVARTLHSGLGQVSDV